MESRTIDTGKAISYGWEAVKKNFWYFVALAALTLIIQGIFEGDKDHQSLSFIGFIISAWLTAGYLKIVFHFYDHNGETIPLSQLFTQYKYFWKILGANILLCLIIGIGFALLIVPGMYWALKYSMTINLIVDKDMDIMEAMKESARMTNGIKWPLFGFMLTCLGVTILGLLCLGVGSLVAVPVVWLATAYIYRNLLVNSTEENK